MSTQTASKPRGICCPTCKVRLRTRETRQRPDQSVRRVKWCPQCGHTVETMERVKASQ
jgi:hypothetical protein